MNLSVKNPKEFWAGLIYIAFGLGTILIARHYPLGTLQRLGPGYFPLVLAVLLLLFGAAAIIRSLASVGHPPDRGGWKPLLYLVAANVVFAVLLPVVGFVIAIFVLALMCAKASARFKWDLKAAVGLVALVAACTVVFVSLLQLPMPIIGSWFRSLGG